ncbi:metallophosphoesterase [Paenibacillus sp. GCM10023252]|uniref:metallophosphoesterase n=1 Tax=Paenibacillus sp. GCM10023252 TaxID=3252649 RepID=UPI0036134A13
MRRTIMISDIHGCMNQFNQMLHHIQFDSSADQLILLGDYVDRGHYSKEVVDKVIELVENHQAIALKGNHDQRLVDLIKGDNLSVRSKFIEHGGVQTIQSYCGLDEIVNHRITDEMFDQWIAFIKTHYKHHIDFLSKLPCYYEDNHHIYVHAGLNPSYRDWKDQPEQDFMYIKDDFIQSSFNLDKKIIFGHTRTIDIHGKSDIWFSGDKIGIDGGCAYGEQLNGLIFQNGCYSSVVVASSDEKGYVR